LELSRIPDVKLKNPIWRLSIHENKKSVDAFGNRLFCKRVHSGAEDAARAFDSSVADHNGSRAAGCADGFFVLQ
jgi:hypothetical protein